MRIVRFKYKNEIEYGIYNAEINRITAIESPIETFSDIFFLDKEYEYSDVEILNFTENPTIVCIGLNYPDHHEVLNFETNSSPVIYKKSQNSILKPFGTIEAKEDLGKIEAEGGLALVIGKRTFAVSSIDAQEYVLGYTCMNDVTARGMQQYDNYWTKSKSFDTFSPFGEWVETHVDNPNNVELTTRVNGKIKQQANTSQLLHNIDEIISYVSLVMPLDPGDIIFTGTPCGNAILNDGDTVTISIESVATLENKFKVI